MIGAPTIGVAVVTHNSAAVIGGCLDTLHDLEQIVIVDNASGDGTKRVVAADPRVELVAATANKGLAAGLNQAVGRLQTTHVLILNPDTRLRPGAAAALRHRAVDGSATLWAPRVVYPDGTPQVTIRTFPSLLDLAARQGVFGGTAFGRRIREAHERPSEQLLDGAEIPWAIAAAWLLPREVFMEMGGLDERYFLYWEDVEFCYRLWRHGGTVRFAGDAVVEHIYARESASRGRLWHRPVRAHWASMLRFYATHPAVAIGLMPHLPRPPAPAVM